MAKLDDKISLGDMLKIAEPHFGKRLLKLILQYIEDCETPRQKRRIAAIITTKITTEAKKSFWKFIKEIVDKI